MKAKLCLLSTSIATLIAGVGSVQTSVAEELVLEEVIVTAQRREESLQDVPLSVTAFDAETLQKSNISEAKDFLSLSPNVGFTEDGQTGSRSVSISIRGVSSIAMDTIAAPSSVGYYVDELNMTSTASGNVNPQLQDMERIEVLRGPQGTYFGRNALGGAINVTTKKPTDQLYFETTASAGSFDTRGLEAILNLPVSDTFMLRAVTAYEESDTVVENVNPNSDNDTEFSTFRVAARWLATDNFMVDFSISHTEEEEGGDIAVGTGVLDLDTRSIWDFLGPNDGFDDLLGFYPSNDDKVNHDTKERNDNETTIYNLRMSWDFDTFSIKSITGFIDSEHARDFDQDNISANVIERHNLAEAESLSQELRIQSTGDGTFDWTLGLYYADDEIERFNSVQAGSEGSYTDPNTGITHGLLPPIPAGFRINENNRIFETQSTAVFGEVTWHITDAWSLTGGARYTKDEIDNDVFGVVAFEDAIPDASGSEDFTNFSPKLSLRYMPSDDLTVYATYSEGYKSGGLDFNGGIRTDFDEEQLNSWEIGFKSTLADGRVRLAGAIFSLDWEDLQVQTNFLADPTKIESAVSKTLNAGEASVEGAELEFLALLSEGLTWAVNLGYMDASYDDFPGVNLPGGNIVDLSGLDLPKTPEWTASTVLDYTTPIGDSLEGFARFEWNYRSSTKGDLEGVAAKQLGLPNFPYNIDSYDVANLRLGVKGENWRVNAYVENLFDEEYYSGTSDNFGLAGIRVRPHPRVFGVSVTYMMGN